MLQERALDLRTSRDVVRYTPLADGRRTTREASIRLYTLTELEAMLGRAGLGLLAVFGDLDGGPLELDSSCLVHGGLRGGGGSQSFEPPCGSGRGGGGGGDAGPGSGRGPGGSQGGRGGRAPGGHAAPGPSAVRAAGGTSASSARCRT